MTNSFNHQLTHSEIKRQRSMGMALAITGATLWGASGSLASYVFKTTHVSSFWVVGVRLIAAGILLLCSYKLMNHGSLFQIWHDAKYRRQLLLFSFLGVMPSQLLYFLTIRFVNPATATVLQFTSPIFILAYVSFATKKLPNRRGTISIIMAVIGTFLLATGGRLDSLSISLAGLIFGIGAGIGNAVYTLVPVNLLQKYDAKLVCGWSMAIGSIPLLPVVVMSKQPSMTGSFIVEMFFIVVFGTMLAYLLFITSINYLNPSITGMLGAFEPLTATVLSVLFLNVHLHFIDVVGGVLILAMTILQSLPERRELD